MPSTQMGSMGPVSVIVDTGDHSTVIPQGFADAVAACLRIAGCKGEYTCRFNIGGQKGTSAMKGLSYVKALAGPSSLSLRLQPGENDTNRIVTVVLPAHDSRDVVIARIAEEKAAINALIKGEITSAAFEAYVSLVSGSRSVQVVPVDKVGRVAFVNNVTRPMIDGYEPEKHLIVLEAEGLRLFFDYDGSSADLKHMAQKVHAGLTREGGKGDFCLHHVCNLGRFEPELRMF